jgi:nitrogenase molybdenum-iron protein alpha/beta subunit
MKQVSGLISTYSSDEFGICSALYELGGMIVMHDASGCNSTYTTHDEPRWYDMDSMIYISAISEMEAIMGDDDKLIHDLIETGRELKPEFIGVVGAPIPYMIGTDLKAIAAVTEQVTQIPCFGFESNGMHHYTQGISTALYAITDRFCTKKYEKTERISVNLLGATPLDFSLNGSVDSIRKWIEEQDMTVNACFAMGSSLEQLKQASKAHVNLVISYGGLAAARLLETRFGIPYVVGVPFGKTYAKQLSIALTKSAIIGKTMLGYEKKYSKNRPVYALIGESVFAASLATAIEAEFDVNIKVLTPLDTKDSLLRSGDLITPDEDDLIKQLKLVDGVIADPMYQPLWNKDRGFYALPHVAFSGRIYDHINPNLINRALG